MLTPEKKLKRPLRSVQWTRTTHEISITRELHGALQRRDVPMINELCKIRPPADSIVLKSLRKTESLSLLLSAGLNVNRIIIQHSRMPLLTVAVNGGHLEAVLLLLKVQAKKKKNLLISSFSQGWCKHKSNRITSTLPLHTPRYCHRSHQRRRRCQHVLEFRLDSTLERLQRSTSRSCPRASRLRRSSRCIVSGSSSSIRALQVSCDSSRMQEFKSPLCSSASRGWSSDRETPSRSDVAAHLGCVSIHS